MKQSWNTCWSSPKIPVRMPWCFNKWVQMICLMEILMTLFAFMMGRFWWGSLQLWWVSEAWFWSWGYKTNLDLAEDSAPKRVGCWQNNYGIGLMQQSIRLIWMPCQTINAGLQAFNKPFCVIIRYWLPIWNHVLGILPCVSKLTMQRASDNF